jgi:nucleoside-diphosphate-sugar epimerase
MLTVLRRSQEGFLKGSVRSTGNVVAVTGANGYLGGVLLRAFARERWDTVAVVQPRFDLAHPVDAAQLHGIDVLVHCAYDLSLRSRSDIWRINVAGTKRLLTAARAADVNRCIVISSFAAFPGTHQLYGRAKLAIEAIALEQGAVVVRPGLVYGPHAGGLVGALRRSLKMPMVPLLAQRSHQYLVHEDDLANAVIRLASAPTPPKEPVAVAHPEPIRIRPLLEAVAEADSRRPRFIPFSWQLAFGALKVMEALGANVPFRAESLWGLAHPAPAPSIDALHALGIMPRRFPKDLGATDSGTERAPALHRRARGRIAGDARPGP